MVIYMYVTVTEFSKKTGDYPSLSATDIKVMALAYQLEKEKVGTDHLKKEPQFHRLVKFTHHLPIESKDSTGFYSPHNVVCIEMFIDLVHLRLDCAPFGFLSVSCRAVESRSEGILVALESVKMYRL
jgi:hypothetical protein